MSTDARATRRRSEARRSEFTLAAALVSGYVACLPVQLETGAGIRFAPSDLFLMAYIALFAASMKWTQSRVWSLWHVLVLSAYALATLLGQMRGGELSQYVVINKNIGLLVLFAAYAALTVETTTWSEIRQRLRVFVFATACVNVLALAHFFELAPFLSQYVFTVVYTGRLSGLLIDPNAYGGLLAVALAVHATTYFSRRPLVGGVPGALILGTLLLGVLYTYSRSTWICVTVMMITFTALRPKLAVGLLSTVAAGIVCIVVLADASSVEQMLFMAARPDQVGSRVDTMMHAIPKFLDNPVFGMGLGAFQEDYGIIIHNTPLWFLTEFGLFGFAAFAGLYGWFFLRAISAYKRSGPDEQSVLLGLIASHIAIVGLSMGIEAFYQRHWWLVMAMISSAAFAAGAPAQRREYLQGGSGAAVPQPAV